MIQSSTHLFEVLKNHGIVYDSHVTSKGWVPILCYSHHDTKLGNAFINVESGVTHCFACSAKYSLYTLLKIQKPDLDFNTFLKILGYSEDYIEEQTAKRKQEWKEQREKIKEEQRYYFDFSNLKTERFNPEDHDYTKLRGFTPEFIRKFKIRWVSEGYYQNYIAIPIVDKELDVHTIEFRKVGENYKSAKCLYPKNINVKETIFNREGLNKNQPIYLREGVSGIAKIWSDVSKNVSAIFGASDSQHQIKVLNQFGKKIFIPDNDDASANLIFEWGRQLKDFWILPVEVDDTDENFTYQVKNSIILDSSRYLLSYWGLDNWKIQ